MVSDKQQRRQEKTVSFINGAGKPGNFMQKNEIRTFSTPYTKTNKKWIKGPNESVDTIKLLDENRGKTLFEINCYKISSDPHSRVMKIKTKIHKCDLIKIKSFCTAK